MINKVKNFIQLKNMYRIWNHPYTILFMLSFFVFARGLSYPPFIFDDGVQIFNNPFMDDSPLYYLTNSLTPIPFLVWKFVITLFGAQQSYPFRLLNIATHALNGYMVWKISNHFLIKSEKSNLFSLIVAIIFMLHPVQVESVVWASSLRTLLGGTFSLLGLYYFLSFSENRNSNSLTLSYIFTFLIIFTYPPMISMVLTYPIFLIIKGDKIKDIINLRRNKNFLFLSLLLATFLSLTFFMHQSNILSKSFGIVSIRAHLELIFTTLGQYSINTLIPLQLYFDYQVNPLVLNYLREDFQTNLSFYTGLMMTLIFLALISTKKTRVFGWLLTAYILFLAPNLGVIHHDFHNMSTVSDRYLYLSLFPYALALVLGLKKLSQQYLESSQVIKRDGLSIVIILIFSILSIRQVGLWKNTKLFLERSTPKAQLSIPLLISLAHLYKNQGQLNQSAKNFLEVLASDPYNLSAFDGLIDIFFKDPNQGSAERVVTLLERKIIVPTEDQLIPLAKIYFFLSDFDKAREFAHQSLLLNIKTKEASNIIQTAKDSRKKALKEYLEKLFNIYFSSNQLKFAYKLNLELLKLYPNNKDYLAKKDLILKERLSE